LVFAYLLAKHGQPVPRDELAEALWGDELPATWEKALSVLVSKLRAVLDASEVDGATALTSAFGCYQLTLPEGSWIDVVAAAESLDRAEGERGRDDLVAARSSAETAIELARRTFLPGESGAWVEEKRAELGEILARGLECLAEIQLDSGHPAEAVASAGELTALEPYRESGYRILMRAQAATGNNAEALKTYEGCRVLLAEELGAYPSSETEAVYLEILRVKRAPSASPAVGGATGQPARWVQSRRLILGVAAAIVAAGAAAAAGILAWPSSSQRALSTEPAGPSIPAHPRVALLLDQRPDAKTASTWFVRSALDGLRLAANEYGLRTRVVSTGGTATGARTAAERLGRAGYDLVLVDSELTVNWTRRVLARYPRTRFVFLGASLGDLGVAGDSNATGIVFADDQSGYLAGYLTGLMEARTGSRLNRRHMASEIGGISIPPVTRLMQGFRSGVRAALPGAVVLSRYSGVFDKQAPCARIANRQIDSGSDIVFAPAGACSLGALSVAGIRGVWGIGVDEDVSYLGPQVLASTVKRFDRGIVVAAQLLTEGALPRGRDLVLGLRQGAVGIVGINPDVPAAVRARLADAVARLTKNPRTGVLPRPATGAPSRPKSPHRPALTGDFTMTVSKADISTKELPDGLQGDWRLTLAPTGRFTFAGNFTVRGVYRVEGERLTIVEDAHGYCPGIPGTYRWRLAAGALDLTTVKDTCAGGTRSHQWTLHPWSREQ